MRCAHREIAGLCGRAAVLKAQLAVSAALVAVAARYTVDRRDNFGIYLPEWLARHNKLIFGSDYLGGVAVACARWT